MDSQYGGIVTARPPYRGSLTIHMAISEASTQPRARQVLKEYGFLTTPKDVAREMNREGYDKIDWR
jgi:hypothetical protein